MQKVSNRHFNQGEGTKKVELPEGEERHDADRDQQLRQEDGVDLWEEEHAVRTALLRGRVSSVSRAVYLPDEGLSDGPVIPGKLGLHVVVAFNRRQKGQR